MKLHPRAMSALPLPTLEATRSEASIPARPRLQVVDLLSDFDQLCRLLRAELENSAWLDCFLLAAGLNQLVDDHLHRDVGSLDKVAGTVNLDDKTPTKSTIELTIDASTIDTHEPKRDGHLKSPDFFDVAKYPTITFKSTKIEKSGKGKFKVTGDLTMHGVTKPVTLMVEGPSPAVKNPFGGMSSGASASGKINRKDWGLTWNVALETGGLLVSEEVKLALEVEVIKAAEVASVA